MSKDNLFTSEQGQEPPIKEWKDKDTKRLDDEWPEGLDFPKHDYEYCGIFQSDNTFVLIVFGLMIIVGVLAFLLF